VYARNPQQTLMNSRKKKEKRKKIAKFMLLKKIQRIPKSSEGQIILEPKAFSPTTHPPRPKDNV